MGYLPIAGHPSEAVLLLALALKDLFARNIIHRDVSNKNILLGREGDVGGPQGVVIDLGVALDFGPDRAHSKITEEPRSVCPNNLSPHIARVAKFIRRARDSSNPPFLSTLQATLVLIKRQPTTSWMTSRVSSTSFASSSSFTVQPAGSVRRKTSREWWSVPRAVAHTEDWASED